VLNDATLADARAVELDEIVEVIDNGSDAPGTILADCSDEFQRRFEEADLIIAKGQGNFESLSDEPGDIFFLFKVKCQVIADQVGKPVDTNVLTRSPSHSGVTGEHI
jgi:damage-control phosphatase, subfamily I